ncbi:sigma-54 interaction domain-containing protein [Sphingobacterium multivorum]|uniref:sigma-54 interaction domain-containing protein n=1 Tax=Sphingobacterium multivorum TaxID=28454 RepID=UPI00289B50B2|nr:sigma-54 dependent transcriptional regulator [Sphingobacterium multivorum]
MTIMQHTGVGSDPQAIYNRIQQREIEQLAQMAIQQKMAPIHTLAALDLLQNEIQIFLGQNWLSLFIADNREVNYSLLFQSKNKAKTSENESRSCKDKFFKECILSAEPILFRASEILKADKSFPTNFVHAIQEGNKAIVSKAFRVHDHYWAILSLGYKRLEQIDPQLEYRIKNFIPQLGITVGNILMHERSAHAAFTKLASNQSQLTVQPQGLQQNEGYGQKSEAPKRQMIGESELIQAIKSQLKTVARSEMNLLIQGESGTGKEVATQIVHHFSTRSDRPLIKVNCAAIAPTLIESELFGHEKGSFSGAVKRKIGKFEQAQGGTLFLDEIGDLPLTLQAKLLRVLQEKEIERVGGNKNIPIDVRIICATHKDLQTEVKAGNFRADLYYRISAFPVTLPSLRERREDIPHLIQHFLLKHAGEKPPKQISKKVLQRLHLHSWPGNIRELEHVIARSILLTEDSTIKKIALLSDGDFVGESKVPDFRLQTLANFEKEYILWVLHNCKARISGPNGAATILGIPATTLQSKMKKLGIGKKFSYSKE